LAAIFSKTTFQTLVLRPALFWLLKKQFSPHTHRHRSGQLFEATKLVVLPWVHHPMEKHSTMTFNYDVTDCITDSLLSVHATKDERTNSLRAEEDHDDDDAAATDCGVGAACN